MIITPMTPIITQQNYQLYLFRFPGFPLSPGMYFPVSLRTGQTVFDRYRSTL